MRDFRGTLVGSGGSRARGVGHDAWRRDLGALTPPRPSLPRGGLERRVRQCGHPSSPMMAGYPQGVTPHAPSTPGGVLGSASGAHSHHSVCRLFESASPDWLIFCLRSSCALLTKIYGSITEVTMWPVQLAGTRVARGRTRLGQSQGFPLTTQCRMRLEHSAILTTTHTRHQNWCLLTPDTWRWPPCDKTR
jgi:hypothetical protein